MSLHVKNKSHDVSRDSSFMFSGHLWEECSRHYMTSKAVNAINQIEVHTNYETFHCTKCRAFATFKKKNFVAARRTRRPHPQERDPGSAQL